MYSVENKQLQRRKLWSVVVLCALLFSGHMKATTATENSENGSKIETSGSIASNEVQGAASSLPSQTQVYRNSSRILENIPIKSGNSTSLRYNNIEVVIMGVTTTRFNVLVLLALSSIVFALTGLLIYNRKRCQGVWTCRRNIGENSSGGVGLVKINKDYIDDDDAVNLMYDSDSDSYF